MLFKALVNSFFKFVMRRQYARQWCFVEGTATSKDARVNICVDGKFSYNTNYFGHTANLKSRGFGKITKVELMRSKDSTVIADCDINYICEFKDGHSKVYYNVHYQKKKREQIEKKSMKLGDARAPIKTSDLLLLEGWDSVPSHLQSTIHRGTQLEMQMSRGQ